MSGRAGGVGICGTPPTSSALQYGHWKSLQNAIVTGAFGWPIKGLPSVFTFLISTAGAVPVPAGPAGREPFHITAPAIRSPATITAAGKNLLFALLDRKSTRLNSSHS